MNKKCSKKIIFIFKISCTTKTSNYSVSSINIFGLLFYSSADKEEKLPETYDKDSGSAQIHGQKFEYKFCGLVFLRAKNKRYNFKLASNMKGLGALDDVFVEYIDDNSRILHSFVQLKSKIKKQITLNQLLAEKGDFSLRKYYESYIQIERKFNCSEEGVKMDGRSEGVKMDGRINECLFILYTNADVEEKLKSDKVTEFGEAEFLTTNKAVLQFNEEEEKHKVIYEHQKELPKLREFLSRFRIFYNQADESEMDCHIKQELQQSIKLPETEIDL